MLLGTQLKKHTTMRSSSKFISYLVLFTFVYSTSVSLALVAKRAPQSVGDALLRRNTTDMGITRITVGRSKTKSLSSFSFSWLEMLTLPK